MDNREQEITIEERFTVKTEYSEYYVTVRIEKAWGSVHTDGIDVVEITENDKSRLFVFNVSSCEHLELASKIHEKVCELKRQLNDAPAAPPTTKVSGKQQSRSK